MKKIVTGKNAQNTAGDKQTASANNAKFQHKSLLVHTVFGVSIVSANSSVYVKIGNEYVVKSADELKKGEEVLFGKEGIPGITLDKVTDALAKSDRYAATQPVLFRLLADGSYTTAFKDALFQGMASIGGWPAPISSDNAFKFSAMNGRGVELSSTQSAAAADFIHSTLQEADAPAVTTNQIRQGWLAGKTIAPLNHKSVFPALVPAAPKISGLLGPNFDEAYKLYVVIRQTVMRTVSLILHGTGTGIPKKDGGACEPAKEGISAKPEIRLVVEHFASDISKNYAAGRVLGVAPLKPGAAPNANGGGEIFKGIVTTKIKEHEIQVKALGQITKERSVLVPLLNRISYEFAIREKIIDDEVAMQAITVGRKPLAQAMLNIICIEIGLPEGSEAWVIRKVNEKMEKAGIYPLFQPSSRPRRQVKYANVVELFKKKLYNGELDAIYGLQPGAIESLYNYYFNLAKAMPIDVEYAWFLKDRINAKTRAAEMNGGSADTSLEMKEFNKLNYKLMNMGLEGGLYKASSEVHTATVMTQHLLHCTMDDQIYSGKITPMDALLQNGQDIESLRAKKFLNDDEIALAELRRIGFGHLEFLYPKANELVKPYF